MNFDDSESASFSSYESSSDDGIPLPGMSGDHVVHRDPAPTASAADQPSSPPRSMDPRNFGGETPSQSSSAAGSPQSNLEDSTKSSPKAVPRSGEDAFGRPQSASAGQFNDHEDEFSRRPQNPLGDLEDSDSSVDEEYDVDEGAVVAAAQKMKEQEQAAARYRDAYEEGGESEEVDGQDPLDAPAVAEMLQMGQIFDQTAFQRLVLTQVATGESYEDQATGQTVTGTTTLCLKVVTIPASNNEEDDERVPRLIESKLEKWSKVQQETTDTGLPQEVVLPHRVLQVMDPILDGPALVSFSPYIAGGSLADITAFQPALLSQNVSAGDNEGVSGGGGVTDAGSLLSEVIGEALLHLNSLHHKGYAHGNLKASNVHLGVDGGVYLLDGLGINTSPVLSADYSHFSPHLATELNMIFDGNKDMDLGSAWLEFEAEGSTQFTPGVTDDIFALGVLLGEVLGMRLNSARGDEPQSIVSYCEELEGLAGVKLISKFLGSSPLRELFPKATDFASKCVSGTFSSVDEMFDHPWLMDTKAAGKSGLSNSPHKHEIDSDNEDAGVISQAAVAIEKQIREIRHCCPTVPCNIRLVRNSVIQQREAQDDERSVGFTSILSTNIELPDGVEMVSINPPTTDKDGDDDEGAKKEKNNKISSPISPLQKKFETIEDLSRIPEIMQLLDCCGEESEPKERLRAGTHATSTSQLTTIQVHGSSNTERLTGLNWEFNPSSEEGIWFGPSMGVQSQQGPRELMSAGIHTLSVKFCSQAVLSIAAGGARVLSIADTDETVLAMGPVQDVVLKNLSRCRLSFACQNLFIENCNSLELNAHISGTIIVNGLEWHSLMDQAAELDEAEEGTLTAEQDMILEIARGSISFVPYNISYPGLSLQCAFMNLAPECSQTLNNITNAEVQGSSIVRAAPMEFLAPNKSGHSFPTRDIPRQVINHDVQSDLLLFHPEAENQSYRFANLENRDIVVLDILQEVEIVNCRSCTFVFGPIVGQLTVQFSQSCRIHYIGVGTTVLSKSSKLELRAYWMCSQDHFLVDDESCTAITLLPWVVAAPQLVQIVCSALGGVSPEEIPHNSVLSYQDEDSSSEGGEKVVQFVPDFYAGYKAQAIAIPSIAEEPNTQLVALEVFAWKKMQHASEDDGEEEKLPEIETIPFSVMDKVSPSTLGFVGMTDIAVLRLSNGLALENKAPKLSTVILSKLNLGVIHLEEAIRNLVIEDCVGPLTVAVAAAQNVSISNCKNLDLNIACFSIEIAESHNCQFSLLCSTQPKILVGSFPRENEENSRLIGPSTGLTFTTLNLTSLNFDRLLQKIPIMPESTLFDKPVVRVGRPGDDVSRFMEDDEDDAEGSLALKVAQWCIASEYRVTPPFSPGLTLGAPDAPFLEFVEDRIQAQAQAYSLASDIEALTSTAAERGLWRRIPTEAERQGGPAPKPKGVQQEKSTAPSTKQDEPRAATPEQQGQQQATPQDSPAYSDDSPTKKEQSPAKEDPSKQEGTKGSGSFAGGFDESSSEEDDVSLDFDSSSDEEGRGNGAPKVDEPVDKPAGGNPFGIPGLSLGSIKKQSSESEEESGSEEEDEDHSDKKKNAPPQATGSMMAVDDESSSEEHSEDEKPSPTAAPVSQGSMNGADAAVADDEDDVRVDFDSDEDGYSSDEEPDFDNKPMISDSAPSAPSPAKSTSSSTTADGASSASSPAAKKKSLIGSDTDSSDEEDEAPKPVNELLARYGSAGRGGAQPATKRSRNIIHGAASTSHAAGQGPEVDENLVGGNMLGEMLSTKPRGGGEVLGPDSSPTKDQDTVLNSQDNRASDLAKDLGFDDEEEQDKGRGDSSTATKPPSDVAPSPRSDSDRDDGEESGPAKASSPPVSSSTHLGEHEDGPSTPDADEDEDSQDDEQEAQQPIASTAPPTLPGLNLGSVKPVQEELPMQETARGGRPKGETLESPRRASVRSVIPRVHVYNAVPLVSPSSEVVDTVLRTVAGVNDAQKKYSVGLAADLQAVLDRRKGALNQLKKAEERLAALQN